MARALSFVACIVVASLGNFAPAAAAPGGGGTSSANRGTPQERRVEREIGTRNATPGRQEPAGVQIDGIVRSGSGAPVEGVLVKLFANGVVIASGRTEADGAFSIEGNPPVGGNNTSVLWFQSPDPDRLLDTSAVLAEGRVARERKLFPSCVQRVEIAGNTARVEVQLMTEDERKSAVQDSGCMEGSS